MIGLVEQVDELLRKQPKLQACYNQNKVCISGEYIYNLCYENVYFNGYKNIKIEVDNNYPNSIPKVYIFNLSERLEHVYPDNSICLASFGELRNFLISKPSLTQFIKRFLEPFIFTIDWHKKYKNYPFGERAHGYKGLITYYVEELGLTERQCYEIARLIHFNKCRGHMKCICGSGKTFRKCHGKMFIDAMREENLRENLLEEAEIIYNEVNNIREKASRNER